MYVRLGFSVAVHVKPEILLIDEVIAVGDEEFQRRCMEHLYKLRREGVTIVIVSHSAAMMESLCDRVTWLDHGVVLAEGKAEEVVRKYQGKVNEDESEQIATAAGSEAVHNSANRRGTGEIRVDDVEFLDGFGNARQAGATGEPLVVRIHFTALSPAIEPVFSIGFRHDSGPNIAGPNTRLGRCSTGTVSGRGYVDYVLDALPLMPGGWRLSVSVVDEHMLHTYDQLDEAFTLHVQPGSSAERYGLVDLQGHWDRPRSEPMPVDEGRDAII
jgi:hypothetical protein